MYAYVEVRIPNSAYGSGIYFKDVADLDEAISRAAEQLMERAERDPRWTDGYIQHAREIPTYPVPFLPGDGTDEVMLDVIYIAGDFARGYNGQCAYCEGDPWAETSGPDTRIWGYVNRAKEAAWRSNKDVACPMCEGRPS
jgi:hypothetical protein